MRAMTPIVVTLREETAPGFSARNDKQNAHVARMWCAWCDGTHSRHREEGHRPDDAIQSPDAGLDCFVALRAPRNDGVAARRHRRGGGEYWMPACAGMTGGEAARRVGWCAA